MTKWYGEREIERESELKHTLRLKLVCMYNMETFSTAQKSNVVFSFYSSITLKFYVYNRKLSVYK